VFLDSDTEPVDDLVDRYFDPHPAERTGLMAGGVIDEPVPRGGPAAARYAYLQEAMSQRQTFRLGEWAFAQMANAACRRKAFEAVGGFREDIRAGEDADLCYRLTNGLHVRCSEGATRRGRRLARPRLPWLVSAAETSRPRLVGDQGVKPGSGPRRSTPRSRQSAPRLVRPARAARVRVRAVPAESATGPS
jgi:hypothetical protein